MWRRYVKKVFLTQFLTFRSPCIVRILVLIIQFSSDVFILVGFFCLYGINERCTDPWTSNSLMPNKQKKPTYIKTSKENCIKQTIKTNILNSLHPVKFFFFFLSKESMTNISYCYWFSVQSVRIRTCYKRTWSITVFSNKAHITEFIVSWHLSYEVVGLTRRHTLQ